MAKDKLPQPQPIAPKKDPAAKAEPMGQVSEGDFDLDVDLGQVVLEGGSSQGMGVGSEKSDLKKNVQASLARAVGEVLQDPEAEFELGPDEADEVGVAQSVRVEKWVPAGLAESLRGRGSLGEVVEPGLKADPLVGSPTPPPMARQAQKAAVKNRFLKLVMALPEDYRAQYTLALANRIKESVADADSIGGAGMVSSEENIQKIEAISWVANEWKRDPRLPSGHILQIVKQIESYFSPAIEDNKYANLVENKDYDNLCDLIDGLKEIVGEKCVDRMDPAGREQIRRIRNAFANGDSEEGNQIMRQFFNSAESFFRMGKEGYQGLSQRNFMAEKDEPFPLVDYFRAHELKGMTDQKAKLRVLELGPGIGNDAMRWIRMSGVEQYLGIDANPKAVETSNQRIKGLFDKGMKGKMAQVIIGNFIEHLEKIHANTHKQFQKSDKRLKTIVVGISVLHYLAVEEREFKRVLGMIRDIVSPTRGRLVMAMKTPRSDTCRIHTIVRKEGGRVIGISRPEKIARAFLERDYLVGVLKDVGFDVEKATLMKQTVKEYDFPGFDEEFECVIAQPKDPKGGG